MDHIATRTLHGVAMRVVETTADSVISTETEFRFEQDGDIVSGDYKGGRIRKGMLLGARKGSTLEFRYVQIEMDGSIDDGQSTCEIGQAADGALTLIERYRWASRSGEGVNTLREILSS